MDEEEFKPIEIVGEPVQGEPVKKEPIQFEDLGNDVYEVGGTRFSGDFFRNFVCPDPEETFRFRRTPEGVVWIDRVGRLGA
jgi:hypothetical protein